MYVGVLIAGILAGLLSAIATAMSGFPVWMALAAYSGVGCVTMLFTASCIYFAAMFQPHDNGRFKVYSDHLSRDN